MKTKLIKLKNECLNELESIGIKKDIDNNITWRIDTRAKRRLGVCETKKTMGYTYHIIGISDWVLKSFKDSDIKNTIIHELLHSIEGCNNHGYKWQRYADIVNMKLGYHITRLANVQALCNDNGIDYNTLKEQNCRYKIICKNCGKVFYQVRLTERIKKSYMNKTMTHTSCGGKEFTIIDLKSHKIIVD